MSTEPLVSVDFNPACSTIWWSISESEELPPGVTNKTRGLQRCTAGWASARATNSVSVPWPLRRIRKTINSTFSSRGCDSVDASNPSLIPTMRTGPAESPTTSA